MLVLGTLLIGAAPDADAGMMGPCDSPMVLPGPRDTLVATLGPQARWRWFRSRKPLSAHA